ncbi:MAG: penicillin-binding protein 2, partial [Nitrospira sp.]|nr:penicillin-binding protein 2 [Nitrospira sp.]
MKSESKKITFMSYAAIAVVVLLIMRLLQLQILHGSDYRKLSEANRFRIMAIPAPRGILFDRNGIPLVKNSPYFCASIIYGEFDKSKVPELSQLLNVPAEALYQKLNGKRLGLFTPIRIKQGLTPAEVAYIESRRSNFPGLTIEVDVSREYLYNSLGSHLIGYIGKLNPAQIKDPAFSGVPPDTFVGQWGVEMFYDNSLRGIYGERVIEVDALGRELRLLREKQPIKGNDIELSIHINVQREAERALGERAGAIVAMDPHTGEILAFVSKPSFDPNLFS